jgi:hypothetical protein
MLAAAGRVRERLRRLNIKHFETWGPRKLSASVAFLLHETPAYSDAVVLSQLLAAQRQDQRDDGLTLVPLQTRCVNHSS